MAVAMVAIFFQGQAKTENEIKLISYNIRTAWGRDPQDTSSAIAGRSRLWEGPE